MIDYQELRQRDLRRRAEKKRAPQAQERKSVHEQVIAVSRAIGIRENFSDMIIRKYSIYLRTKRAGEHARSAGKTARMKSCIETCAYLRDVITQLCQKSGISLPDFDC